MGELFNLTGSVFGSNSLKFSFVDSRNSSCVKIIHIQIDLINSQHGTAGCNLRHDNALWEFCIWWLFWQCVCV